MLARLGGREFAALFPKVRNRTEVEEIARRLERSFDDPYSFDGHSIFAPQEVAKGVGSDSFFVPWFCARSKFAIKTRTSINPSLIHRFKLRFSQNRLGTRPLATKLRNSPICSEQKLSSSSLVSNTGVTATVALGELPTRFPMQ
jgi:hypothetical protein